jgi:hypothetical protein
LRVEETKQHIFLFIDRVSVYAIPKRNFPTDAAAVDFLSTVKRYIDAAHQATE